MANPEHLKKLKQGTRGWNQWREENREVKPDLSHSNLNNADLWDANFSNAHLRYADLIRANLSDANLKGADLSNANLTDATLNDATLNDANLTLADLTRVNLSDTQIWNASLTGANLKGARLINARLINANLTDASLVFANLNNANLNNANLNNANLEGAYLEGAHLIEANLESANLESTNLIRVILHSANLSNATLNNAILINADLTNSNFSHANLNHADLFDADLRGADFEYANLCGANLALTKVIGSNLVGATLTGACIQYWNINAYTNLQDVVCDYVFMGHERKDGKLYYGDRRPHDPNQNFAPGEFTKRYQIVLESVDLFFNDGIDWKAFLASLHDLQTEYGDEISVQSFEKKAGGAFLVKLEVPTTVDKGLIEQQAKEFYQQQLQLVEAQYRQQLQGIQVEHQTEIITLQRQHNADILELAKLAASKPITVEANAVANADNQSKTTTFNQQGAKIANQAVDGGIAISGQFNDYSTTTVTNNLNEITTLIQSLHQLAQTFPTPQRDEVEEHLSDLQEDLKQLDKVKSSRLKATLGTLLAIAVGIGGAVATATDFTNNVLELSNKFGIELVHPQANPTASSPSPMSSPPQSTNPSLSLPPSALPTDVKVEVIDP